MYSDTEALYGRWEATIQKLKDFRKAFNDSKINHSSMMFLAITRIKQTESVTLAEKLAKCSPEVLEAEGAMLEAQRMVFAGEETLDYLASMVVDLRNERKEQARVV